MLAAMLRLAWILLLCAVAALGLADLAFAQAGGGSSGFGGGGGGGGGGFGGGGGGGFGGVAPGAPARRWSYSSSSAASPSS